jgi:RNA polymerase sigma-70 factor, ECF subfamily
MTDKHSTDTALLQQAQVGDYDAFDALHECLRPAIRRFVVRLIGECAEVDDIVQMTFIALYRNLTRINPPETLRPYVYKIARNQCIDELRRQGCYAAEELEDEFTSSGVRVSFTDAQPAPEDAVHWMLVQMEVMHMIDELPEHHRQTLILYAEQNLSIKEIALTMDVSEGTVKSRLHHARKKLKARLHPNTLRAVATLFDNDEPRTQS